MKAVITSLVLLAVGMVAGGCSCSRSEEEVVKELDWGTGAGKGVARKLAEREGVAGLAKLLKSKDSKVRMRAIIALGTIKKDPEATKLLLKTFEENQRLLKTFSDEDVRIQNDVYWAIIGLATQGAPQAKGVIEKTLKGDNTYLCQGALMAIGELGDKSLYPLVFQALDDPRPGVGRAAASVRTKYNITLD